MTTRTAIEGDQGSVLRLLSQLVERDVTADPAYARSFRRMLNSDRGTVIVVEDGSDVLGVISCSFNLAVRYDGGYAQVEELVVDERARGKNAGATLVRAAIDEAKRRGCAEIGLYAREHNRPFYEKLGFVYAGPELRQPLV